MSVTTVWEQQHAQLQPLLNTIEVSKSTFAKRLEKLEEQGGLTRDMYVRYLSFQYHLTKGVQRHFLKVAGHPRLSGKRSLREFLFKFALEEEPHYRVAEVDLERMGEKPLACTLDVSLWWAYLDEIVEAKPLVRLGVACVLENLGAGAGELGHRLMDNAKFLNKGNTRFLSIHFHEVLPHGLEILDALSSTRLNSVDLKQLIEGANIGAIMYLRMVDWALNNDSLTCSVFDSASSIPRSEEGEYSELEQLISF